MLYYSLKIRRDDCISPFVCLTAGVTALLCQKEIIRIYFTRINNPDFGQVLRPGFFQFLTEVLAKDYIWDLPMMHKKDCIL